MKLLDDNRKGRQWEGLEGTAIGRVVDGTAIGTDVGRDNLKGRHCWKSIGRDSD